jgi:formylmethanofuran dehydrogenase subunit C
MIKLTLRQQPNVPLEAEVISPDVMAALDNKAIRALTVYLGKKACPLDEFFDVDGEASDQLEIHGDAKQVKWIGRGMSRGSIKVVGNVGMHAGAYMKGGAIEVSGNASDWLGGEMANGLIRVEGNAGGQVGAAYRGSRGGMRNGLILVGGSAGLEVGMRMKRGTIVIGGPVRDFAGLEMKGGTLVLRSGGELRTGAWMNRGTIISLAPIPMLPTFLYAASYNPTFLSLYAKRLRTFGIALPFDPAEGRYVRYTGDSSVPGRGEILVWKPHAA